MGKWRKVPPEMAELLDGALQGFSCQKRPMFGCPAYFVNGNMFTGLHQDSLFVRLSSEDRQQLLTTNDEAAIFEPMEGRPMKEYVVLPETMYNDAPVLGEWLHRSYQYVLALPIKVAKEKKK